MISTGVKRRSVSQQPFLPCGEYAPEICRRQFCVRVFDVVRGSPHPACGHLLPIRCGEGIYFDSSPRPSPRLARRGRSKARLEFFAAICILSG